MQASPTQAAAQIPPGAERSYPRRYVSAWTRKDGTVVTIRPIRPADAPLMRQFHAALSERSVYQRYFTSLQLRQRIAHERLQRICCVDYGREIVLVVEQKKTATTAPAILAVGRLVKKRGVNEAEFAIIVADAYQGQGIGSELLRRFAQIARDEKISCVTADILPENLRMLQVCKKCGFQFHYERDAGVMRARIQL